MIRRFLSGSLAVALIVGVVAGPAAAAEPHWKIVPSPNIGDDANGFADVARIPGTKRFWAVGAGTDIFEWTPNETLIARWNGYAWELLPSPNVGDQDNFLTGVSVRSPSNAWAVGAAEDAAGLDKTLVEHWNGRAWKVVPSPNEGTAGDANELEDVRAFSRSDVWAVGYSTAGGTLTLHFDGSSWTTVPAPDVAGQECVLSAITGVPGSNRRFAVGYCTSTIGSLNDARTLIERWNGSTWTIVPSPAPGVASYLNDVTAVSGHELWAVGASQGSGLPGPTHSLTVRWSNGVWDVVPSPDAPAPSDQTILSGIGTVPGTTTLWAVGSSFDSLRNFQTFAMSWDGDAWVVSPTALGLPGISDGFSAVAASGARNVWAVGDWYDPDQERHFTLAERYG